jgi:hypothetical protein
MPSTNMSGLPTERKSTGSDGSEKWGWVVATTSWRGYESGQYYGLELVDNNLIAPPVNMLFQDKSGQYFKLDQIAWATDGLTYGPIWIVPTDLYGQSMPLAQPPNVSPSDTLMFEHKTPKPY